MAELHPAEKLKRKQLGQELRALRLIALALRKGWPYLSLAGRQWLASFLRDEYGIGK